MNEHERKVLFSSKSAEWETPKDLYKGLVKHYGEFTLDPAATKENAMCKKYYTKEDDGLSKSWEGEKVFLNPPYGREVRKWVEKAYVESQKDDLVKVVLIPVRPDTVYWSDYCSKAANIFFIKGRLRFNNRALPSYKEDGSYKISPATFPSSIIVFDRCQEGKRSVQWCDRKFKTFW